MLFSGAARLDYCAAPSINFLTRTTSINWHMRLHHTAHLSLRSCTGSCSNNTLYSYSVLCLNVQQSSNYCPKNLSLAKTNFQVCLVRQSQNLKLKTETLSLKTSAWKGSKDFYTPFLSNTSTKVRSARRNFFIPFKDKTGFCLF